MPPSGRGCGARLIRGGTPGYQGYDLAARPPGSKACCLIAPNPSQFGGTDAGPEAHTLLFWFAATSMTNLLLSAAGQPVPSDSTARMPGPPSLERCTIKLP